MNGTIPKVLLTQMKTNSEVRKGRKGNPSRPMTSRTTALRTRSTSPSATRWMPLGTSDGLRNARTKNTPISTADRSIKIVTLCRQ
jgi:hypothetical protein